MELVKERVVLRRNVIIALLLSLPAPGDVVSRACGDETTNAVTKLGGAVHHIAMNSDELEVDLQLRGKDLTDEGLATVAKLKAEVGREATAKLLFRRIVADHRYQRDASGLL